VVAAIRKMAAVFEHRSVAYALIGGMATSFRGRPRSTRDVYFIVSVPQLALPGLLDELEQRGFEFDLATAIRQYVQEHMTALSYRGVRIDWIKPILPLYQHVIDQARTEEWLGTQVRVASPESLILTKLIAFRDQDLMDIATLLASNRGGLDLEYLRRQWSAIAEADSPQWARFEEMVARYHAGV
jgi:hypothetical protein